MGQQGLARHIGFKGIFYRFPRPPFATADRTHEFGDALGGPFRHAATRRREHRCAQYRGVGTDALFGHRAQDQMPSHAVADQHMGTGVADPPLIKKGNQIRHPGGKIIYMTDMGMRPASARSALPSPVNRGNIPSLHVKIVKCL